MTTTNTLAWRAVAVLFLISAFLVLMKSTVSAKTSFAPCLAEETIISPLEN